MCGSKCSGKGGCSASQVEAGCVVLGAALFFRARYRFRLAHDRNRSGDAGDGPWTHAAFGVGAGTVDAHTSPHCHSSAAAIYRTIDGIMCPPSSCVPPATCGAFYLIPPPNR